MLDRINHCKSSPGTYHHRCLSERLPVHSNLHWMNDMYEWNVRMGLTNNFILSRIHALPNSTWTAINSAGTAKGYRGINQTSKFANFSYVNWVRIGLLAIHLSYWFISRSVFCIVMWFLIQNIFFRFCFVKHIKKTWIWCF